MDTLITCTGGRPEAWKQCLNYMYRQTFTGPIQWIIVDDVGDAEIPVKRTGWELTRVNGPKAWKPGINTQRLNLDTAIHLIKGNRIAVIEDDDWYHPEYLERMFGLLKYAGIAGEGFATYYNVKVPGYKRMLNRGHASLCQTVFLKELVPMFEQAVNSGELYIDLSLWGKAVEENIPRLLLAGCNLAVGMKGLPGKGNIGVGDKQKDYMYDIGYRELEALTGKDSAFYKRFRHAANNKG